MTWLFLILSAVSFALLVMFTARPERLECVPCHLGILAIAAIVNAALATLFVSTVLELLP